MFMANRKQVMETIALIGSDECAYTFNNDAEAWLRGNCDCKFGRGYRPDHPHVFGSEQTGCPEMRSLYAALFVMEDEEWEKLVVKAGGIIT